MPASGLVTDVIQGRQLSLDEFEQVLGLNAVLEVCHIMSQCITVYSSMSQHVTAHLLAATLIVLMLFTKESGLLAAAEPLLPSWNKVDVAEPHTVAKLHYTVQIAVNCMHTIQLHLPAAAHLPELHRNAATPT